MKTDIQKLEALAKAASQGPWVALHPNAGQRGSEVAGPDRLNQICGDVAPSNALFIAAANPAAVLELIAELQGYQQGADVEAQAADEARAEVRKLKAENEALRKDAGRYHWLCNGNGYFMEENGLCGHTPDKAKADAEIDEAMAQEQQP